MPSRWGPLTVEAQAADPRSHLTLYKAALAERKKNPSLGDGSSVWNDSAPDGILDFTRDPGFRCMINIGTGPFRLPSEAEVLVASGDVSDGQLAVDDAVWLKI